MAYFLFIRIFLWMLSTSKYRLSPVCFKCCGGGVQLMKRYDYHLLLGSDSSGWKGLIWEMCKVGWIHIDLGSWNLTGLMILIMENGPMKLGASFFEKSLRVVSWVESHTCPTELTGVGFCWRSTHLLFCSFVLPSASLVCFQNFQLWRNGWQWSG